MELKDLIAELEKLPADLVFPNGFGDPNSWRGSYSELAFEPRESVTAGEMLANAKSALGAVFTGYKGGDYVMTPNTSVHIAHWGRYGGDEDALTRWRWKLMLHEAGHGV